MTNEERAALVEKIDASTERIMALTARIDRELRAAQRTGEAIPLSRDERVALRTLRLLEAAGVIGPVAK